MRRFAILAAPVLLAACGTRSTLYVDDPSDAAPGPDVLVAEVAQMDTSTRDALDVPVTPCTWIAEAPVAITGIDRDRAPSTLRVVDDQVWIGFQSSNPDPPGNQGHFVRITDATGQPVAPAHEVVPSPPQLTSYMNLSLWTNTLIGEFGAMAWNGAAGCRIVLLDRLARPTGRAYTAGPEACTNLAGISNGWSFLEGAYGAADLRLVRIDPAGNRVEARSLGLDASRASRSRLVYADGTFLFSALVDDGRTSVLTLRRYDLLGNPIGPVQRLATREAGAVVNGYSFHDEGDGVLLSWREMQRGARYTTLWIARLDREGRARSTPVAIAESEHGMFSHGVSRQGEVVVVAYNPYSNDVPGELQVRFLRADTLAQTGALQVDAARFPHNIMVRPTSAGFVVGFGALGTGLTQVWTALLACRR